MPFAIDTTSRPGVLQLKLSGTLGASEMADFVAQHDRAIDGLRGRDYRVFCDIRDLAPLTPICTALFERAKRYSASRPNFRGSAVLASSTLARMQHRRTSEASGVMSTELISDDEHECWRHLSIVWRES